MEEKCPFCGLHPFEYVEIGIGQQAVAVYCCEYGYLLYDRGWSYERVRAYRVWDLVRHFVAVWLRRISRLFQKSHDKSQDEWDF